MEFSNNFKGIHIKRSSLLHWPLTLYCISFCCTVYFILYTLSMYNSFILFVTGVTYTFSCKYIHAFISGYSLKNLQYIMTLCSIIFIT